MSFRSKLAVVLGVIALTAAACYFFLLTRKPSHPAAEARSSYADPGACAGCHSEIAKTYRLTGMGRSLYRPRPESTVEDYSSHNVFYHRDSDRYYTMLERDGKLYQRRHQLGFDGQPANVVEYAVDFVIGSGNHARTYLHRSPEGKLIELPVSWYAEKGGYWAMSPGYDRPDQRDFRRAISYDCLFCHNGYPGLNERPTSGGNEPILTGALPEGIDCQRCHGPGQQHVQAAQSGRATVESIRGSILNPARLSRERQLDVCMQCHLETTSRQLPGMLRRFDREPFSYRPGEPLGDYAVYFDHAPGQIRDGKFEVAHAAYRLRKSACFRSSQMTCTTCHNPHQSLRGAEASQHYTSVCRTCHATAHPSGTKAGMNCVDCHMPKRRTDDAVHVVMTDHFIQRSAPAGDLLAPLRETDAAAEHAYQGAVVPYYPDPLAETTDNELYVAIAQVQNGAGLQAGIPRLQQSLDKNHPVRPEFYFELGKAESKAGRKQEAIRWFEEALRRQPDFRPALKELASALVDTGELGRAAATLEKAETGPTDSGVLTDLGNVYLRLGNLDKSESALQSALAANPDEPEACNLLGLLRLEKRDQTGAEKAFRDAIRTQPDLAAAHSNLASLLAGGGDYAQAKYHYEKAIASDPAYVDAHHGYGLLLLLTKSYDGALAELRKTVQLAPDRAQAQSDLADLLAARGSTREAVDHYRLAVRLKPDLADAQLALAKILAQQGNASEAREHFEKAAESPDPAIRQAALQGLR
ncbi:MAG: tetratricopeptide repeat protein [Acidobacteriia bacterium]|nr:tetratricopeptide repeat protein [Terriglobia bacterium]